MILYHARVREVQRLHRVLFFELVVKTVGSIVTIGEHLVEQICHITCIQHPEQYRNDASQSRLMLVSISIKVQLNTVAEDISIFQDGCALFGFRLLFRRFIHKVFKKLL